MRRRLVNVLTVRYWLRVVIMDCSLRPQFLGPPPAIRPRALVKRVPISPCLRWVAQISLFHRVRHNDDESEVFARNRVMQIVRLAAEREVLVVVGFLDGLAWRRILERAWQENISIGNVAQNVETVNMTNL